MSASFPTKAVKYKTKLLNFFYLDVDFRNKTDETVAFETDLVFFYLLYLGDSECILGFEESGK